MTRQPKNQHAAFADLALPHLDALYGAAMRFTKSHAGAEDLVQETMLRAYQCWHQFDPSTNCRAWLFRILSNSFINGWRRKTKEREVLEGEHIGVHGDRFFCRDQAAAWAHPEVSFLDRHLSSPVVDALSELRPDFRAVVELSDLQGFTYREIADTLEIPIGTVMSRLFRARQQLRQKLGDHARQYGLTADANRASTMHVEAAAAA
jgi:RNA polymerase sigma-70 factor (ECF subfamily)